MNPMRRYLDILAEAEIVSEDRIDPRDGTLRETEEGAMLFHVTFASRLRSIKRDGIQPGRKRNWNNTFGAKLGDTKAVYLFTSFTEAVRWAFRMQWDFKKPAIILCVKPNAALQPDPKMDVGFSKSVMSQVTIAPDEITRIIPMTDQLAKEVATTGNATFPA